MVQGRLRRQFGQHVGDLDRIRLSRPTRAWALAMRDVAINSWALVIFLIARPT